MKKLVCFFCLLLILSLDSFSQQNFWQQSNGPFTFGGFVTCMNLDNDVLIVGTWDNGIYRSENLGNEWLHCELDSTGINSITSNSNGYLFSTTYEKIFRSSNNGLDWEELTVGVPAIYYYQITFGKTNSIFLATSGGLFRSKNLGNDWVRIDSGFIDQKINRIANGNDGSIYAVQDSSIYVSQNDGEDWFPLNNLPTGRIWDLVSNNSNDLFLTINVLGVSIVIGYRSTDNGSTWQQFGSSCPNFFYSIQDSPDGNLFTVGAQYGVYKSIDKGESWNLISSLTGTNCMSFYSEDYIFSGSYTGIRKSINAGADWQLVGLPNSYTPIGSLAINSAGYIFAGTGGSLPEVFKTTNHGQTWINISGQFDGIIISGISIDNRGHLFVGSYDGGIYYSNNSGLSWEQRNNGLTSLSITCIKSDQLGTLFVGTWDAGIFRSTNGGSQWSSIDQGLTAVSVDDIEISNTGNIYLATTDGIFVSNDQGNTWIHLNNGWPEYTQSISLSLDAQGNIFADAAGTGIFKSTDFGSSWTLIDSSIYHPILDISFNSLGYIFVAGANGVFRSTDSGNNWALFNSGLAEWNCVNKFLQDTDGRIIAGTEDRGVCWTTSVTSIQDAKYIAKEFTLSQNYPNPFNPSTVINYQLPTSGYVTLKVFDVLGNEVATLVDEYRSVGSYEIEFNPASSIKHLPAGRQGPASGIYFYRLQAGDYFETKKMILLK